MSFIEKLLNALGFNILALAILGIAVTSIHTIYKASLDPLDPNYIDKEQYYSEGYNDGINTMEQECVRRGFAYFKPDPKSEDGPVFTWKTKEEVCGGKK